MIKKQLLKVLTTAKIAVEKNCTTLGSDCFVVRSGVLYNTNERICIVQPFPEDVSFTVNAETFLNAVKSIKDDELDLSITDKDVTVRGGRTRIKISQSEEQISSRIVKINPKEPVWKNLPKDFTKVLQFVLVNTVDRKLNGIYLSGEYAYSTDGWQINRILLDSQFDPIWLSQRNVTDLIAFGDMEKYTMENAWLYLNKGDTHFSCRKLDHTGYPLPLLEKTIKKFTDSHVAIDDQSVLSELYQSVKAAVSLADTGKVSLQIADGELFVEASCATGNYSDIIDVEVESMELFTIYAKRIVDILSKPGIASVSFCSNDGKKAVVARGDIDGIEWMSLLSAE